jgi:hypothetical protein
MYRSPGRAEPAGHGPAGRPAGDELGNAGRSEKHLLWPETRRVMPSL